MENDFLQQLSFLGVTARIKRLNESLTYGIKDLYRQVNVDIEPSWHLVFLVLKEHRRISMKELAGLCHISQPAITKMIKKMHQKRYIHIVRDNQDLRKKQLSLTKKALSELPKFESIWQAGYLAIAEMLNGNPRFMESLAKLEAQNAQKGFKTRALQHLEAK